VEKGAACSGEALWRGVQGPLPGLVGLAEEKGRVPGRDPPRPGESETWGVVGVVAIEGPRRRTG
jgi:hypothetical protein